MLSLSFTPCDDVEYSIEVDTEMAMSQEHQNDHKDHCSPFCVCSCCGTSITFEITETDSYPKTVSMKCCDCVYSFLYNFSPINSIWHPPSFITSNTKGLLCSVISF